MIKEFVELFYPNLCLSCNDHLLSQENYLCASCLYHLPQTQFHVTPDNPLAKSFWGRVNIHAAYAFLYFKKGGVVQEILHQLKYKGNKELALFMGNYYGGKLAMDGIKVDGVAAVPLHKSKLAKRGYNQSEWFAAGMAQAMQIPDMSKNLVRLLATETQTKKGRFDRWTNVDSVFGVIDAELFRNKHVLVLDDVITTGSTIESLANSILAQTECTLSVAAIATPQS